MTCPECSLTNPPYAERCDCGYDFKSRTIEEAYGETRAKKPGEFTIFLALLGFAVMAQLMFAAANRKVTLVVLTVVAAGWFAFLYSQLIERKNWARIAIAICWPPIGTILMLSPNAKKYCQRKR